MDEFQRVWKRKREVSSDEALPVLHGFSFAVSEVRKVGTSGRTRGDIMRKTAIESVYKTRVRIKKARVRALKQFRGRVDRIEVLPVRIK